MTIIEKGEQICNNPEALKMANALMLDVRNELSCDEITELVWDKFFG